MSGEDGKKDHELEIHPAPDVTEFANTFVAFREAITKALTDGNHTQLNSEQEIELFRIWYMDRTDREILKASLDDNNNDNEKWFRNGEELGS